ncbi:MAG: amidohydrolase family protein [Planctomycetota bacterium]
MKPPPTILRVHAAAAADHHREWPHPVTAVLELTESVGFAPVRARSARLITLAHRDLLPPQPAEHETDLDLTKDHPGAVLIPGLVNAHAHLDLTHIGPKPHDPAAGFIAWGKTIRDARTGDDAEIAASVCAGVDKSIAGGTVALADIDGSQGRATPHRAGLPGTSYIEHFGFTPAPADLPDLPESADTVAVGLSPHAPYSVSIPTFEAAVRTGLPLCTHLAESPEEREFILRARGPMRTFLESIGKWNPAAAEHLEQGKPPLTWFEPLLTSAPGRWLLAHVNDCPEGAIDLLRRTGAHVAYCPRASEYFANEHHFGAHRYRDMLDAGVNVCLGTDSIVNLDTPNRISVLDEMRRLFARDRTAPDRLFEMATVNGARALRLDPAGFRFTLGAPLAGLVAVPGNAEKAGDPQTPPREAVLIGTAAPIPVLLGGPNRPD